MAEAGIEPSVGSVGDSYDNALAETINGLYKAEVDSGAKPGLSTDMAAKMKALEREVRELRQANEILRKASAYFAMAELDRPFKR